MVEEWGDHYVRYKPLKKLLTGVRAGASAAAAASSDSDGDSDPECPPELGLRAAEVTFPVEDDDRMWMPAPGGRALDVATARLADVWLDEKEDAPKAVTIKLGDGREPRAETRPRSRRLVPGRPPLVEGAATFGSRAGREVEIHARCVRARVVAGAYGSHGLLLEAGRAFFAALDADVGRADAFFVAHLADAVARPRGVSTAPSGDARSARSRILRKRSRRRVD